MINILLKVKKGLVKMNKEIEALVEEILQEYKNSESAYIYETAYDDLEEKSLNRLNEEIEEYRRRLREILSKK